MVRYEQATPQLRWAMRDTCNPFLRMPVLQQAWTITESEAGVTTARTEWRDVPVEDGDG